LLVTLSAERPLWDVPTKGGASFAVGVLPKQMNFLDHQVILMPLQ
jgi:hypothetical protein